MPPRLVYLSPAPPYFCQACRSDGVALWRLLRILLAGLLSFVTCVLRLRCLVVSLSRCLVVSLSRCLVVSLPRCIVASLPNQSGVAAMACFALLLAQSSGTVVMESCGPSALKSVIRLSLARLSGKVSRGFLASASASRPAMPSSIISM